jgi:hypothetical protein
MLGVLTSTIVESPAEAAAAIGLLALGLPLYPIFRRRERGAPSHAKGIPQVP